MKALSLTQPWASLVAIGAKKIETRSWATNYRGEVAIHASKGFPGWAQEYCDEPVFRTALWKAGEGWGDPFKQRVASLPRGAIIAVASLVACKPTGPSMFPAEHTMPKDTEPEYYFGDYSPGRFMWFLEGVRALREPVECKGALSLWEVPAEVEHEVRRRLAQSTAAIAAP